jgi:hypothetical protein
MRERGLLTPNVHCPDIGAIQAEPRFELFKVGATGCPWETFTGLRASVVVSARTGPPRGSCELGAKRCSGPNPPRSFTRVHGRAAARLPALIRAVGWRTAGPQGGLTSRRVSSA